MKLFFASDHAGFALKNALMEHFRTLGYSIKDFGSHTHDSLDDYPDFVLPFARALADAEKAEEGSARGVIVGGSGQGEAMCANRVQDVRAAVFYGPMRVTAALEIEGGRSQDGFDLVRLARRHNNANVLAIGARFVSGEDAEDALHIFLDTPFSDSPRHARRIAKF